MDLEFDMQPNTSIKIHWHRIIPQFLGYLTRQALSAFLILYFMKAYIDAGLFQ